MIAFPNCKINLGLNIIRKRSDNYHDIETLFYPINLTDALEVIAAESDKNEFTVTGFPAGDVENNLCLKAYYLLKKDYPELPFIKMHLHKAVPIGAGLGGGSADAAFTLKILKEKFLPSLTTVYLNNLALQLGSDCPFFLYNQPCLASGRGEILAGVDISLSQFKIMLVNPGIHINTAWAFSQIKPVMPVKSIAKIIAQPVETWKEELINDFEVPVFKNYPEIKKIKDDLYKSGAHYASLSGSGSTVYGIFDRNFAINPEIPQTYFRRIVHL